MYSGSWAKIVDNTGIKTVQILNTESLFNTKTSKKVKSIELDPNVKLLFRR